MKNAVAEQEETLKTLRRTSASQASQDVYKLLPQSPAAREAAMATAAKKKADKEKADEERADPAAAAAPPPPTATAEAAPKAEKKKNNKKIITIVAVVGVLVLVGGIGIAVARRGNGKKSQAVL